MTGSGSEPSRAAKTGVTISSGVIAAVLVLGGSVVAIAAPKFMRYGLRSKVTEVRTNLHVIGKLQEEFRATHGHYSDRIAPHPPGPPDAAKAAWSELACPATCTGTIARDCTTFACLDYQPAGDVLYRYACETLRANDGDDFTCAAAGDLDGDGKLDLWVLGTANRAGANGKIVAPIPTFAGVDPGDCAPGETAAGEVVDCKPDAF